MSGEEIQRQIAKALTAGDYNENLAYAMSLAVKAIPETSTGTINYLLLQSIAQSLVAINLQLECLVGHIMDEEEN